MRLQHLVKIKMTLPPVSRVTSCMHKFLWKLLSFITVCEDFKSKYRQRWDSRKSEGISLQCLFEQKQHDLIQENHLKGRMCQKLQPQPHWQTRGEAESWNKRCSVHISLNHHCTPTELESSIPR